MTSPRPLSLTDSLTQKFASLNVSLGSLARTTMSLIKGESSHSKAKEVKEDLILSKNRDDIKVDFFNRKRHKLQTYLL